MTGVQTCALPIYEEFSFFRLWTRMRVGIMIHDLNGHTCSNIVKYSVIILTKVLAEADDLRIRGAKALGMRDLHSSPSRR